MLARPWLCLGRSRMCGVGKGKKSRFLIRARRAMRKYGFAVLFLIALANIGAWAYLNQPVQDVPWSGTLRGVSFSPNQKDGDPLNGKLPTIDDIDRDLAVVQD